jgi:hypothetical protein
VKRESPIMSLSISGHPFRGQPLAAADLNLPYRGERDYIHSADIFQAVTDLARTHNPDAYVESLVLRRQAVHQIRVAFEAAPQTIGTFSLRIAGDRERGWLVERNEVVRIRVPYDESPAMAAVVGGAGFARFAEPVAGYTAFEQLLVLLKVTSGERTAWLCQTDFNRPLRNTEPLAVRLRRRAMRFLGFEIMQNEQTIGTASASLRS